VVTVLDFAEFIFFGGHREWARRAILNGELSLDGVVCRNPSQPSVIGEYVSVINPTRTPKRGPDGQAHVT